MRQNFEKESPYTPSAVILSEAEDKARAILHPQGMYGGSELYEEPHICVQEFVFVAAHF